MTGVAPFRGLLYNPSKVYVKDVIAPPYDIITPYKQKQLYKQSIYNIVRIDFGLEYPDDNEKNNKYTRASENLHNWLEKGVIEYTKKPSYFIYESTCLIRNSQKIMRGIFGAVRLVDLGNGIYPHEETHSKPKTDRLNLLHACHSNISPIFSLYNDPDKKISEIIEKKINEKPYFELRDDENILHRFWIIDIEEDISKISSRLSGMDIFIADGHHRYETALEYKRQMSKKFPSDPHDPDFNYVMMFLVNISEGGTSILPTHRLLKEIPDDPIAILKPNFDIEHIKGNEDITDIISGKNQTYGLLLADKEGFYVLKYKGNGLMSGDKSFMSGIDVVLLHELIFKKLYNVRDFGYEMDVDTVIKRVRDRDYKAAFFLNDTMVEDVERVARAGFRMPPKSTYFYPKIPTGLVINSFKKL